MYDVIALGELLIDFAALSTDADGYPCMAAHPGGAPANLLAAVNKFGGKTALIGKVGNDTFGRLLLGTLERGGIDTAGMKLADEFFTTLAFVTFDEHGDRSFAFSRKPGADTQLRFEDIDLGMIDKCRVFHFGTLSLTHEPAKTATVKAVEYAKSMSKLISFDPNLRKPLWASLDDAKAQIDWGLRHADIVKISDEEVEFMWGIDPQKGAGYILENYKNKLVFVTCGAEGCYFRNAQAAGFVPSLKNLSVTDTTGAGDIFFGSAIWKLLQAESPLDTLREASLKEAVMFANTSAGLSTTKQGGISSVPEYSEVEREMKAQYRLP